MKRKAFWPSEGIKRQIPGLVADRCMDAEVTDKGVKFFLRGSGQVRAFIKWEDIFATATIDSRKSNDSHIPPDERPCPMCGSQVKLCRERGGHAMDISSANYAGLRIVPAEEEQ